MSWSIVILDGEDETEVGGRDGWDWFTFCWETFGGSGALSVEIEIIAGSVIIGEEGERSVLLLLLLLLLLKMICSECFRETVTHSGSDPSREVGMRIHDLHV